MSFESFSVMLLDIFVFGKNEDDSTLERSQKFGDIFKNWWKIKNHKIAYKLLHMAQHGDKNERSKAVTTLSSLSYLKGKNLHAFC